MIGREDSDLEALRQVVRDFLAADDTGPGGIGAGRWLRACSELGLSGVAEPDEDGGAGAGFAGLAIVLEEAGRVLSPLPILSSVVLGQGILRRAGDGGLRQELLPRLLDGSATATVAIGADQDLVPMSLPVGRWTISGTVEWVLDGDTADWIFIAATTGRGRELFVVDGAAAGLVRTVPQVMDLTRGFARITFADTPVRRVACDGDVDEVLAALQADLSIAVACEQLGAAQRISDLAVEYVKTRIQFGRPIGSFQAIKHRCAELAIDVDRARSAVAHAVWAVGSDSPEVALAAPLAGVVCAGVLKSCAAESIQLHGGIGFTWEHPAHLYFRRAVGDAALFADVRANREAVLAAAGVT